MIHMSPEYRGCPECGDGEVWLLTDGQIMCANWPECGVIRGSWRPASEALASFAADLDSAGMREAAQLAREAAMAPGAPL